MSGDVPNKLRSRVVDAAESALARESYVSALDILTGLGWLNPTTLQQWRQGRLPSLEGGIQTKPARIAEAMEAFRAWATERGLQPSETEYLARSPARPMLRFSTSGDETIELHYRTHWISPDLSEKERGQIIAKANRPPELVVIQPLDTNWKCHRCGATGGLLMMEAPGPACLSCAGLAALEFLPAGDAGLSRRAKAASWVHAVVVRFSRTRKRYERQGLLVEPQALRSAGAETKSRGNSG